MVQITFEDCNTALVDDLPGIIAGKNILEIEINLFGCRVWIYMDIPDLRSLRIVGHADRRHANFGRSLGDLSLVYSPGGLVLNKCSDIKFCRIRNRHINRIIDIDGLYISIGPGTVNTEALA